MILCFIKPNTNSAIFLWHLVYFPRAVLNVGKIIFMAPTRPLVSQQCEACIHILSLPPEVCTVLDGHTPAPQRANHYQTHNLIFCTPQTVQNDLDNGILDGRLVVCVCVDEAHRATANYAYTCIIAHLAQRQQPFRVLALTATPGGEMKRIQQVRVFRHLISISRVYTCKCAKLSFIVCML